MKSKIILFLVVTLAVIALVDIIGCRRSGSTHADPAAKATSAKYHCPMHPTYVSDKPGDCPICGMSLVLISKEKAAVSSGDTSKVSGRATIHLDPEKRQLIGLTTALVETQKFTRHIRANATLSHDETSLTRIAPRFGGWVRELHVNYIGQEVGKGDPLFTAYSPELFAAENDYLITLRASRAQTNNAEAARLLEASRRRLELMQIGDEEIRVIGKRNQTGEELLFRAPDSGHVISKTAVTGKAFMPGESLYEIASLSRLWVRANVYEFDLNQISVGQKARVVFPNLNNQVYESTVAFISPHIDPQTRRAEVRIELANPQHILKPDMWANVEIEVNLGEVLTVPASAVIDTGTRNVAFVDRDDSHLEPREVKIGAKTDDYWQVLNGLQSGEKVVTRALFLVDSESQLKAAISGMGASGEHKH